jgi:ornithine cyclodeaminase/alanine dehydrogenase-like protein (mu-crystallin family)
MKTSRRTFLKSSAAAVASTGVMIVPSSVLGNEKRPAPSERITLACIGVGNMGTKNLKAFLQDDRIQVVDIFDVDENHLANALEIEKLKPYRRL